MTRKEKQELVETNKQVSEHEQKKRELDDATKPKRDSKGRLLPGQSGNTKGRKGYKQNRRLMNEMLEQDDLLHAYYLETIKENIDADIAALTPKQRMDFFFKALDYILPKVSRKEVHQEIKKTFKVELPDLVKKNPEVIEAEFEEVDWQEDVHAVDGGVAQKGLQNDDE